MDIVLQFIKENVDIIDCGIALLALFFGGKAYSNYTKIESQLNNSKVFKEGSIDQSQHASGDLIINNNTCDTTALVKLNNANFETSLNLLYGQLEKTYEDNVTRIVNEAKTLIETYNLNMKSYSKIDWINFFLECAQSKSDSYMQGIWSKVLVTEIAKPGSISFKTLDVLKNMSTDDFHLFERLCAIEIDGFILQGEKSERYIDWRAQLKMNEYGLLNLSGTTRWYKFQPKETIIVGRENGNCMLVFHNNSEEEKTIEYNVYLLTTVAEELREIANYSQDRDCIQDFLEYSTERYGEIVDITFVDVSGEQRKNNVSQI